MLEDAEHRVQSAELGEEREVERNLPRRRWQMAAKWKRDQAGRGVPLRRGQGIPRPFGPDRIQSVPEVRRLTVNPDQNVLPKKLLDRGRSHAEFRTRESLIVVGVQVRDFLQREDVVGEPNLNVILRHDAAQVARIGVVGLHHSGPEHMQSMSRSASIRHSRNQKGNDRRGAKKNERASRAWLHRPPFHESAARTGGSSRRDALRAEEGKLNCHATLVLFADATCGRHSEGVEEIGIARGVALLWRPSSTTFGVERVWGAFPVASQARPKTLGWFIPLRHNLERRVLKFTTYAASRPITSSART